jgi:hypothetical protein
VALQHLVGHPLKVPGPFAHPIRPDGHLHHVVLAHRLPSGDMMDIGSSPSNMWYYQPPRGDSGTIWTVALQCTALRISQYGECKKVCSMEHWISASINYCTYFWT